MRKRKKAKQIEMEFRTHGGKRAGAGRKLKAKRRSPAHRERPEFKPNVPQHVVLRVVESIGKLRSERALHALYRSIGKASDRFETRLVQFSVQDDHVHLVVESASKELLTSAMKGLGVRIAQGLHKVLGSTGQVIESRYYAGVLGSPTQVRRALAYVLNNHRHHAIRKHNVMPRGWVDPYSSGYGFDGWNERPPAWAKPAIPTPWLPPPRHYHLRVLWREQGLIAIDDIPGPIN